MSSNFHIKLFFFAGSGSTHLFEMAECVWAVFTHFRYKRYTSD